MVKRLKYIAIDRDRHGNERIYFRRHGIKTRLRGPFGSPEFLADYQKAFALDGRKPAKLKVVSGPEPTSIRWLCIQYFKSSPFTSLDPRTQKVRRSILEKFCRNGDDGAKPYAMLLPRHIRIRRDEMSEYPQAANGMVKALRQLYRYAINYDFHDTNPAEKVEYLKGNPEGFHTWTLAEVAQFEATHPVGSMARLALGLALYTGQRRSDLVNFGPSSIQDGWLVFRQHKGRNSKPVYLEIPIIPELASLIEATPSKSGTFLATSFDKPFTSNGFGNRFRKWCNEAGLSHCSVHGLRKAAASRLAELGCTEQEIMAITGHRTSKEVARYTRAASQKLRAESALKRISNGGE
ncbi:tyrosine-type recombinase/integrase [Marivivens sp. LCG002]|uniref:tyrosine-type recombinase/integrase n=1 Tax=Marivivens sp. LCG002 TaxID=3051171 RepID=UPI002554EBF9|nr:tyrosine-type recombinase/integrase [Marivivens sp. LCG002]WIV50287.1 tyrosine-type recombinase/integrase [Marivivens sp. LCG002]